MKIRMKIWKLLFFQIQNLNVKVKTDAAIILEIIKVAKQVILVEKLPSFVCYTDKALLQHLAFNTYSNLLQVLIYGCISIWFLLQEHKFLNCKQYNIAISNLFLRSVDISTFFVHYLTFFGTFYCKYFYYFRDTSPAEKNTFKYICKLPAVKLCLLTLFISLTTLR